MTIKTSKSFHKCKKEHISKSQFDMLIFEIRNLRKDVEELKGFMNKSKGTLAVLLFIGGLIATVITALDYFKR
jgi:hypothetical protein